MGSLGIALGIGSLTCFLVLGLGLRTFVIDGLVIELPVGTLDVKPSGSSVLMGLLGNESLGACRAGDRSGRMGA